MQERRGWWAAHDPHLLLPDGRQDCGHRRLILKDSVTRMQVEFGFDRASLGLCVRGVKNGSFATGD